jgi:hypothetical protein
MLAVTMTASHGCNACRALLIQPSRSFWSEGRALLTPINMHSEIHLFEICEPRSDFA